MHFLRWQRLTILGGFALLIVFAFFSIPVSHTNEVPEDFDMQVVLGGNTRERSEVSHALWLRHRTPILVTGDGGLIRNALMQAGVPEGDIIHEPKAGNTWQNAEFSRQQLVVHGVDSVVIVTSWFHTSRALGCFEKQMPDIRFSTTSDVRPEKPSWDRFKVEMIERMKILYYWATRAIRPW